MRALLYVLLALLAFYAWKTFYGPQMPEFGAAKLQARPLIEALERYRGDHGAYPGSLREAFFEPDKRPPFDFIYEGFERTPSGEYRAYELAVGKHPKAYVYSSLKGSWRETKAGS